MQRPYYTRQILYFKNTFHLVLTFLLKAILLVSDYKYLYLNLPTYS